MAKVIFIDSQDMRKEVEIPSGWSLMEGAVQNGIDAIIAECGGSCACATCHCYISEEWIGKVVPPDMNEEAMLETVEDAKKGSRLSCQIKIHDGLDGLVVHLPDTQ